MTPTDIRRFFRALAVEWPHRTGIILIGGAAAVLEGSKRATSDVDFEASFGGQRESGDDEIFARALHKAGDASGIQGQFTEDIGAWSQIALPPWRKSARFWRQFGPITVKLLDPALYAVSKLRRGDIDDFSDLILTLRRHRTGWRPLASACAKAVRLSPSSTILRGYIRRVEFLFKAHGVEIWGQSFNPVLATDLFRRLAKLNGR